MIWLGLFVSTQSIKTSTAAEAVDGPDPPHTRIDVVIDTLHGVAIPDPYRWLEDGSHPETREWITRQDAHAPTALEGVPALSEYGDASDSEQFEFLYAYSPYQKVRAGTEYPAVLLITGDADTRVPPLQARKLTARVHAATASTRPILLLYDTKAGHAGGAQRP